MKIVSIRCHNFRSFTELDFSIKTGAIFGRESEGKTNLCNAIISCFTNTDLFGSKIFALNNDAKTGWVNIIYLDDNGEEHEIYRTWTKTPTGFSSSISSKLDINKKVFLAIANPSYVFALDNSDRCDLFIETVCDTKDAVSAYIPTDPPINVTEFTKAYPEINISDMITLNKSVKSELKTFELNLVSLESQLEIISMVDALDIEAQLKDQIKQEKDKIGKLYSILNAIDVIKREIAKKAEEELNKKMLLTRITDGTKILYNDTQIDQLSASEKLQAGLEIANAIASYCKIVPPTMIDGLGFYNIDAKLFPNLTQIITTAYADVDLCEHVGSYLYAINKSWKKKVTTNWRPEIQISMIPFA